MAWYKQSMLQIRRKRREREGVIRRSMDGWMDGLHGRKSSLEPLVWSCSRGRHARRATLVGTYLPNQLASGNFEERKKRQHCVVSVP
jgi:hypothetical protein